VTISPRCYRWWASEVTAFANRAANVMRKTDAAIGSREALRSQEVGQALNIEGRVRAARTRKTAL